MKYLHGRSPPVLHRDLKSANMVVSIVGGVRSWLARPAHGLRHLELRGHVDQKKWSITFSVGGSRRAVLPILRVKVEIHRPCAPQKRVLKICDFGASRFAESLEQGTILVVRSITTGRFVRCPTRLI
jgi:serine/threonine protein kinase